MRYAITNPVGAVIARAVYGVKAQRGATAAMVVTTSRFTGAAIEFAKGTHDLYLRDFRSLQGWLEAASGRAVPLGPAAPERRILGADGRVYVGDVDGEGGASPPRSQRGPGGHRKPRQ
jgi:hypothetical protein